MIQYARYMTTIRQETKYSLKKREKVYRTILSQKNWKISGFIIVNAQEIHNSSINQKPLESQLQRWSWKLSTEDVQCFCNFVSRKVLDLKRLELTTEFVNLDTLPLAPFTEPKVGFALNIPAVYPIYSSQLRRNVWIYALYTSL